MKSSLIRILSIILILSFILSSWPVRAVQAQNADSANLISNQKKKLNNKKEDISKIFGTKEEDIQTLLNQGYTSDEVNGALARQKVESIPLNKALGTARKINLNRSKDASVTDRGKTYVMNLDNNEMTTASAAPVSPISEETLKNLDLKLDNAPFRIGDISGTISTLDGSLMTSSTDFVLPGRNGLSFSLKRSYNSSDSQYYDISKSYYNDLIKYDLLVNATVKKYRLLFAPVFQMTHTRDYATCAGIVIVNELIGTDTWALNTKTAKYADAFNLAVSLQSTSPNYVEGWSACTNNVQKRDKYYYAGNASVEVVGEENTGISTHDVVNVDRFDTQATATQVKQTEVDPIAGSSTLYLSDTTQGTETTEYTYNRYYVDSGSSSSYVSPEPVGNWNAYQTAGKTYQDINFPLGKGWSWDVPYILNGQNIHLSGGGTYEISGTKLKGYPFDDLTFTAQTGTVSVNQSIQTYSYILSNASGIKQYFNSSGQIIKMVDPYNNYIDFSYTYVSDYGQNLLTSISDPLGNQIKMQYTAAKVTVTYGDRTTTYDKISISNSGNKIELLDRVTDPENRVTRYAYQQATDTRYNLLSNDIASGISDGYALLKTIYYPTGAETYYSYEFLPVTRYIGPNAVIQSYRVSSREDRIVTVNPDTKAATYQVNNPENFTYDGDYQSSYGTNMSFSSTVDNGLSKTKYSFDRAYTDSENPTVYYNTQSQKLQSGLETTTTNVYDRIRKLTVPDSSTVVYKNTQSGASRSVTTSQIYDNSGNMTSQTNEQGVTIQYTYFPGTHLIQTISQPTDTKRSLYTIVTKTTQGDPDVIKVRENNSSGNLLSMVDYDYDTYGNITRVATKRDAQNLSLEAVVNMDYAAAYNYAYLTNEQLSGTDANNAVFTVKTQAEYNRLTGQMTKFIDGNQKNTLYEYDKLGRIKLVTNPDSSTNKIDYNDSINTVTQTNEAGAKTESRFDPLGRLEQLGVYIDGVYVAKQKNQYDAYSRLTRTEDAEGNQTNYTFLLQPWGNKTVITAPDSSNSYTQLNVVNLMQTTVDSLGNQVNSTLDVMGNPVVITSTDVSTENPPKPSTSRTQKIAYDYLGNVVLSEDAKHNKTNYGYDSLGRLISVTNPLAEVTSYHYDLMGNVDRILYPDQTKTTKTYDIMGRVILSTKADGTSEKYIYDGVNNVLNYTDASGQEVNSTYNFRNQLLTQSDGEQLTEYKYTSDGLRERMTDSTGITSYIYNTFTRQLESVTYPDQKKLKYGYDDRGNIKSLTGPFNDVSTYGYDSSNRMKYINDGLDSDYGYYSNGALKSVSQGNGVVANYQYRGLQLTALNYTSPSLNTIQYQYEYDENNNINGVTKDESHKGVLAQSYTYDVLNRIQTSSLNQDTYTYDSGGNRKSLQSDLVSNSVMFQNYTYDKYERLTSVLGEDQEGVTYRYNGDGLMVERTKDNVTVRYYYNGTDIIAEARVNSDGSVTKIASYVRGLGLSYRSDNTNNKSYYMLNGHGDTEYLTDASGNILNSYSYDLWGKPILKNEKVSNPFLYSGEYWDSTTNLQYLRARWYDPSVGRFINEDTYEGQINNPLSLNLYTYTANNPMRYKDPSGHWLVDLLFTAMDVVEFAKKPSWANAAWLGTDALSFFDPTGLASTAAHAGKAVKTGKTIARESEAIKDSSKIFKDVAKGCNCFVAGTKVQTDEGEKNIEDIKVGDRVLSKDEETGEVAYKEVTATFNHETGTDEIYKIHVGDQVIESTFNHPFWVDGQGWTFVKDLKVGDLLVQSDGNKLKIERIELEHESATVYNMTVDDFHTYFVSDLGIWVHNTGACNWKSVKQFGHTFSTHGAGAKNTKSLIDRARSTGNNQGQWLDNQKAADFIASKGTLTEATTFDLPSGMGQVITPTGDIISATKVIIVPSPSGVKTAYPIP